MQVNILVLRYFDIEMQNCFPQISQIIADKR